MADFNKYPIIAFIATKDVGSAKEFYGVTLGLRLLEDSPFAVVFDAHGVMLRVTPVKEVAIGGYTVLGWHVPDIVAAARELQAAGVVPERYPGIAHDELGIWSSPAGDAKVAWFKDPDGNTLSISQH
jgi:catechol 2,3-dioxygenase-like lactoylglutathione lyase family enzyme